MGRQSLEDREIKQPSEKIQPHLGNEPSISIYIPHSVRRRTYRIYSWVRLDRLYFANNMLCSREENMKIVSKSVRVPLHWHFLCSKSAMTAPQSALAEHRFFCFLFFRRASNQHRPKKSRDLRPNVPLIPSLFPSPPYIIPHLRRQPCKRAITACS